ncbi:MAG: bifunctional ADP-dependent NAD(P)H-hydrate dehydratase/NAD(P)H-hydrate epimerase [Actinomycetales bacterium]|nr:bifunctional ADP-dependent NAD(P)H-hydrate dehydratase/NAD(P)H-hydrate epimerase [Actinomycetales bacterium]
MIDAFRADDVRAAEEPLLAAERGFAGGLMHRAATALELAVRRELRLGVGRVAGATVVGLVGPGNNGGDALHALAGLARHGVRAVAVATSARVHEGGLAALRAAGGTVLAVVPEGPGRRVWLGDAAAEAFAAEVVLDGLLGIGARGGLRGAAAELVEVLAALLTTAPGAPVRDRPLVVAVDVPSGVGVDDGTLPGPVLPADRTLTFGVAKPTLLLPPAAARAGRVDVVDLGLAAELAGQDRVPAVRRLGARDAAALFRPPGPADDKYRRGVVGVVAGTATYPGAAVLAVGGALGAGCGMVRYVGPDAVRHQVLAAHPEVVASSTADVRVQAWVLGPGVADDDAQAGRVRDALAHAAADRVPTVVDAGGLELLPAGHLPPQVVLTPHAGELARLLTRRGVAVDRAAVEAEPARWAREAAERTGATVLLKGHTTLVAGADGLLAQADAPAWLATAGAGDVLAGVLGALLAGRAEDVRADPALAARLAAAAALVHGRAAHAAGPGPLTAGAVAAVLPRAVADLLAEPATAPARPAGRRHARLRVHAAPRRVVR